MKIFKYTAFISLLAILLISPVLAQAQKSAGRIVSLSGIVNIQRGQQTLKGRPFLPLNSGDVVQTGTNSRAAIILSDETLIKLNADSKVTITFI